MSVVKRPKHFFACSVLILASALPQSPAGALCAGFEISAACITAPGLDQKAALYRHKIAEAMTKLGASYQITLRLINHSVEAGYDASRIGDVFTEVVRNEEMRNQSFIINVTADFLEKQPRRPARRSALGWTSYEFCEPGAELEGSRILITCPSIAFST